VSDTPRTDEFFYERARRPGVYAWLKYARTIERELTDSNAELRRLHIVNAKLLEALNWIDRRCPKHLLDSDPHKIHREAAYDAGASARAAIAKAEEVKP
jgi:hypothetical protein